MIEANSEKWYDLASKEAGREAAKVTTKDVPSFAFVGGFASGKSFYSVVLKEMLEREFGVPMHEVHISAPIKEIARREHGMVEKDRSLLNRISREGMAKKRTHWVDMLVDDVKKNGKIPFIVDDVRFVHDAETLKANFPNIVIVRIETSYEDRMHFYKKKHGDTPTSDQLSDPTEVEVPLIRADITILNQYGERGAAEANIRRAIIDPLKAGRLLRREDAASAAVQ